MFFYRYIHKHCKKNQLKISNRLVFIHAGSSVGQISCIVLQIKTAHTLKILIFYISLEDSFFDTPICFCTFQKGLFIYFNCCLIVFHPKYLELRKIGIFTNLIENTILSAFYLFLIFKKFMEKKVQPGARIISTDPVNIVSIDY